jgi:hypothetical protein
MKHPVQWKESEVIRVIRTEEPVDSISRGRDRRDGAKKATPKPLKPAVDVGL